jgi:hypothetical protein
MEHLHHQRRRVVLLLSAAGALSCSAGDPTIINQPVEKTTSAPSVDSPPGRDDRTGADQGAGNDPGNGVDREAGIDPKTPPECASDSDCPGGKCQRVGDEPGQCRALCTGSPSATITNPCDEGTQCVYLSYSYALCLPTCVTVADCPPPKSASVLVRCVEIGSGGVCVLETTRP